MHAVEVLDVEGAIRPSEQLVALLPRGGKGEIGGGRVRHRLEPGPRRVAGRREPLSTGAHGVEEKRLKDAVANDVRATRDDALVVPRSRARSALEATVVRKREVGRPDLVAHPAGKQ